MSADTPDSSANNADESLEDEFKEERRNRMILGIAVFVIGILATLGILYYFGAASAVGW